MTQTIEIVRISPSTLEELRNRAGNNHLDDIILKALQAYDASLDKDRDLLDEVLEQAQSSFPSDNASSPVPEATAPDADSHGNCDSIEALETAQEEPDAPAAQPVDAPAAPPPVEHVSDMLDDLIPAAVVPDIPDAPESSTAPDNLDEKVNEDAPEAEGKEVAQETVSAAGSFDAEPQTVEVPVQAVATTEVEVIEEDILPTPPAEGEEGQEAPEPEIIADAESGESPVITPAVEPDAPTSSPDEAGGTPPSANVEIIESGDIIRLPVEAGNPELAYTTPEAGIVDGRIVHPTAWFSMLGEVVIRLAEVTGRNPNDLVNLINASDLGIRGRIGEVRTLGFQPVRDAGLSIRKVSSGKTWGAIVRIANKFGITVQVRLKWQDDKPGIHPGRHGFLHISVKNNSES